MSKTITKSIFELLKPLPISRKLSAADLSTGSIPVYSSETQNNGIKGFCDRATFQIDNEDFQRKQYIVFGDHTRSINVVCQDFSVMDNVKVLVPLFPNLSLSYIKSQWYNKIPQLGYARHWNVARKVNVEIPVTESGNFDLEKQEEIARKYKEVEEKRKALLDKIYHLKSSKIVFDTDDTTYSEVSITDLFVPKNGNGGYTKEWCQNHSGDIPLYSGNTFGAFAFIDVADYEGEYITWAKDGLAGFMLYHNGKFSLTGHRGILLPTEKCRDIDLLYIKYLLEPIFRANIKGRLGVNGKNEYTTLNATMIKKIPQKLKIPIKPDGCYDIEKQRELSQKYAKVESIKRDIYQQIVDLTSITVL